MGKWRHLSIAVVYTNVSNFQIAIAHIKKVN